MIVFEVLLICFCIAVVGGVIANSIYKKMNHKPSSDCAACHDRMARAVKKMKKDQIIK